jgi:phage tail sheath protein FI
MAEYPGVYVEEISTRTHEIAGVATSTAAFVGFAPSGPADPIIIEGIAEYEAEFGKISEAQPLSSAVADFFANGGMRAVIVRAGPGGRRTQGDQLIGDATAKTGLSALERVEEAIGLLLVPDVAYLTEGEAAKVTNAAASFAEAHGIFHIADIPNTAGSKGVAAAIQWSAGVTRNRNVALYYPWLVAGGAGKTKAKRLRPPSAVAAGIYARLDNARGVWKAPAGGDATTNGVADLGQKVTAADAEQLQSASINAIRTFEGKGIALWGARTFAAEGDHEWKYVNVRRLLLFLEHSIDEGLQWAVFELNDENLWARIRLEVSSFLHTAWRAGAFLGSKPEDAYFVTCDATTMTQDDIDNGRLIVLVGVAPVRPAEFVIFRIQILLANAS